MNTTATVLNKQKSHAFGKDTYLLGSDNDGIKYWLEAPKWDCGWYWGFGYVKTYTNNSSPSKAKDINSHQHIDSSFMGNIGGKYVHNIFDAPTLKNKTFSESEGWVLSELFKTFYTLKKTAELYNRGGSHLTTNPLADLLKDTDAEKHINEVLIPAVTAKIIEILTPSEA